MYSLAIYIYLFCVNLVAMFNRKARLLMVGHSKTYDIMRRGISKDDKIIWFHAASLGEFRLPLTVLSANIGVSMSFLETLATR